MFGLKNGLVLLAVNEMTSRVLLRSLLQFEGYEVKPVDGLDDLWSATGRRPASLLIIDAGYSHLIPAIKKRHPRLPIIALAARLKASQFVGVDWVFEKPLSLDELLLKAGQLIDHAQETALREEKRILLTRPGMAPATRPGVKTNRLEEVV